MENLDAKNIIRLSKSCIGDEEKKAVMDVLDAEYLGMGINVREFELALSDFFGKEVVCVGNGTAALHLTLQACGVGLGDEVLVQSLTYAASFQAISAVGARPIACDICKNTLTLDWKDAEKRLTERTKAVMPVHYAGDVGKLKEIYAFANSNGLRVIEDAAHAFGSLYQGKRVGSFGDVVCFSFDGIKNITSGEGGCIVTDDLDVLRKVKDARLLGVEKDSEKRFQGERSWEFDISAQGWRYHMSNIMAAIGIEQLKKHEEFSKKRRLLATYYDDELDKIPFIEIFKKNYSEVVPHIYVIRVPGLDNRKSMQEDLIRCGIQTGIHYQPNHLLSFYSDISILPLSVTDEIFPELISLPLHPQLTFKDIEFICNRLANYLRLQNER